MRVRAVAAMLAAAAIVFAACADDAPIAAPPDPPPADPGPETATERAIAALDATGWWDWATGIVGIPLEEAATRETVGSDVLAACESAAVPPATYPEFLADLDAIASRRARIAGQPVDTASLAVTLDAAISAVCPEAAAMVDSLRPRPATVAVDERHAGNTLIVPDPRPGDLRTDPTADVLPLAYEPPAAHRTILDVAYHDDPAQKLDLHLPDNPEAPIIVFLHSGGWVGGDKQFVPDMVMRLVEEGYAVASVGYRLAPAHPFPAPVHDVKHAIRWLKGYAAREGLVDGDRIVLYGASAGGHLAAFVAATPGEFEPDDLTAEEAAFDSTVSGVVSVVGPTDLVSLYTAPSPWAAAMTGAFVGCSPCEPAELRLASPDEHVRPGLPPAYWAYGEDDGLVDAASHAATIAPAWGDSGGIYSSWLDLIEGSGHNIDESTINQRWVEAFIHFVTTPG